MRTEQKARAYTLITPWGATTKTPTVLAPDETATIELATGVYRTDAGTFTLPITDPSGFSYGNEGLSFHYGAFDAVHAPRGTADATAWVSTTDGLVHRTGTFTNAGAHPVRARLVTADGQTTPVTVAPGASASFDLPSGLVSVPGETVRIVAAKTVEGVRYRSVFKVKVAETTNQPPQVTLTTPAVGASLVGRFTVTGTASDDYGLAEQEVVVRLRPLLEDGTVGDVVQTVKAPIASDGTWRATLDALALPAGTYRVVATARDNAGQVSAGASQRADVTIKEAPKAAPALVVLSDDNTYDGVRGGDFNVTANLWWGQNGTTFRLYENGVLVSERDLADVSPAAQSVTIPITGKPNGTYVYTCEMENARGITPCATHTVTVTDASPAQPVLSQDDWDGDGSYTVSADLWWGTNATSWTLVEDGAAVATGSLTAATPSAQHVAIPLTGRIPGTHLYRIVFANPLGETTSRDLKVTVR